jgi:inner membrane protein
MDNVTHTLTGLALARAGLKRFTPHGTLLVVIAANLPDIDMVSWFRGWLAVMEEHRGYTHSLIGLPVMAAFAVGLTALFTRRRLPWARAWLVAFMAVVSHLLLDWSMSYGVRPLIPFSSRWFHLDWYPLLDWVVLAVLAIAWLAPALGKLVSEEIGARQGSGKGLAVFALCFVVIYGCFRGVMHARVISQLNSRLYEKVLGGAATRMAAFPQSLNPFAWNAVVEGEHAYRLYTVSPYGTFNPDSGKLIYKKSWDATLDRVSRTRPFQYALYFSRFPYWEEAPENQNLTRVSVTDVRFGAPGESFFRVSALVDATGNVEQVWFGNGGMKQVE